MGSVRSLAFSADGTLLATSGLSFEDAAPNWGGVHELGELATGPGRLKVWGVQVGTLRNDLVGHSHANAVVFSPDGAYWASAGSWQGGGGRDHDGSGVILWAPNTGIKLRTFPINTNGGTWSVSFSPEGKLMAISSRTFDKDNDTSTSSISLLRTATGILEWKQTVSDWGQPVAFSPDGKSFGVLCGREAIRFFDTETGTLKHHLGLADPSQGARWNDFALLSQGRLAIAGVDNARQGKVEIWDFTGPNVKVSAIEKSLDRQNARSVVETFVAAALAGDGETVITLAKLNRRDPKRPTERIENMIKFFPDREHLPMTSVHVNDAENPTDAIAISKQFKWEHPSSERKTDVVAWFTLSMSEAGWIVTNISFEWIESTDGLLKKFLEANPKSVSVPPQASSEAAKSATGLAEKNTVISELGLWVVPASAEEVLTLGVTRTPAVPGGVRVTKIVPGGYIDTQIKAGKLKFEVGEIVHSVAARDVTSAKDVSRNILSTRRGGHSGFFIGSIATTWSLVTITFGFATLGLRTSISGARSLDLVTNPQISLTVLLPLLVLECDC